MLNHFPVVAILGARQCGKTTLSKQVSPDWHYIDLENPNDYDRIKYDPVFFFSQYPKNVIIDEAQLYPELFQVLRGVIDQDRQKKGRFILTGSSSPDLLTQISESLAGRIALVELGTLKVNEYAQQPLSKFYQLFDQPLAIENLPKDLKSLSKEAVHTIWLKGGYPEPLLNPGYFDLWMDNYRATYINRDIANLFPRLNRQTYQRFLGIMSHLSGTKINRVEIGRGLEASEGSVREYLSIADGTYLWRQLPSFERDSLKSVVKMPKGHIRDNGLLHYLLKINNLDYLYSHPQVGHSFESFVIEEILKGLSATNVTNWQAYYYRTRNGAEIDLIIDGPFGTLPIEIKYGEKVQLKQLSALKQFIEERNLPFGLVINQADKIEWLTPKILQLPVGYL
ncbi:MAG: AAA family ATPase [Gammaproteobacteria bacterium]|nr:AAA family ATPase [Gammaproteobacteria bacterium]